MGSAYAVALAGAVALFKTPISVSTSVAVTDPITVSDTISVVSLLKIEVAGRSIRNRDSGNRHCRNKDEKEIVLHYVCGGTDYLCVGEGESGPYI